MIRQISNVKLQDIVTTRSSELLAWLGIEDLGLILKERRLRWYGHVELYNGAVKTAFDIRVAGKHGPGRPNMTWKQLTERDCREWKLSAVDPHDRHTVDSRYLDPSYLDPITYVELISMSQLFSLYIYCISASRMSNYFYVDTSAISSIIFSP